jgi:hypothetical protein
MTRGDHIKSRLLVASALLLAIALLLWQLHQ